MDTTKKTFKAMDITDYRNADDNEFEEEVYEYQDDGCEGSYMNFIFCPTLQELFQKYDYDIKTIDYEPMDELDEELTHFKHYAIDFRGVKGEIVIDYSDPYTPDTDICAWMGSSVRNYPIHQLLKLHVNIPSWNKYGDKVYEEKEIANRLYNLLNWKPRPKNPKEILDNKKLKIFKKY